jgi:cytosine/adenosine deaminase-related metal-dependent hydrolase
LIHGNYLTQHEIELAAKYRERLSMVYCPRTHVHFQHSPYPLNAMRQAGLRVVLGTDSRASSPDLNLWQETSKYSLFNRRRSKPEKFERVFA